MIAYFYLDGQLINSTISQSSLINGINPEGNLQIGRYGGGASYTNGIINEVQIWNTSLNQQEIQQYMICSPTGNESGLVGYWNFEEVVETQYLIKHLMETMEQLMELHIIQMFHFNLAIW